MIGWHGYRYVYYMPENDVSEETYVSEIEKMLTVEGTTTHGTKVISKKHILIVCRFFFSVSIFFNVK